MIIGTLRKLMRSTSGATAVEYGLICGLIVVAMLIALTGLADTTTSMWNKVAMQVLAH